MDTLLSNDLSLHLSYEDTSTVGNERLCAHTIVIHAILTHVDDQT